MGSGRNIIICLHGFGESRKTFGGLENALGKNYALLSVDLPFHGETEWRGSLLVHPEELIAILEQVLMKSGFEHDSIDRKSVV